MAPRSVTRRRYAGLALLAILLRVMVPAGYMPAALDSGWYLSLCPHGMPDPAAVAALDQGGHHDHHEHRDHAQHGHDHDMGSGSDRCDLGSGFALSAVAAVFELPLALAPPSRATYDYSLPAHERTRARFYDGRAPPPLPVS